MPRNKTEYLRLKQALCIILILCTALTIVLLPVGANAESLYICEFESNSNLLNSDHDCSPERLTETSGPNNSDSCNSKESIAASENDDLSTVKNENDEDDEAERDGEEIDAEGAIEAGVEPANTQEAAAEKAADPEASDPEATDPEVVDPEVTDPEATDPDAADPEVTDPEATDPEAADPEVTDPEVTDPEATDPEANLDGEEDEAGLEDDEAILEDEEIVGADAIEPEEEPKDMQDAASAEASDGLLSPCAPTGWREKDGVRYYIDPITNKRLKGGLFTIDGEQYCFDPKGILVTGWMVIDEEVYYFDPETGAMVTSCDKIIKGLCAPLAAAGGSSFTDVSKKTPHSADVSWTFESGISTGWVEENGTRTFRPMSELARADMAAFLYRLAGSPAFVATKTDAKYFSDVDPDTPHANEIWWLASAGISEGWLEENGTRTFRPYDELARADMAAFLYRIAGSPSYSPSAADREYFTDVKGSTPHAKEIRWLGSVGVSEGWTEDDGTRTFRPLDTIKRQDMAAFLHRMVANEVLEPSAEHEYRFDSDGHVVTGWNSGEFFDPANGALVEAGWAREATRARYISPSTGSTLKDGVHTIAGYKYIFNTTGNVRHGWIEVDGARRFFSKDSGRMYTNGIYKINGARYCFASDGTLRTGLVTRGSATYYFDPSTGKMQYGLKTVDGVQYYFDKDTGIKFTSGNDELDHIIHLMIKRFGDDGRSSLYAAYEWIATFPYMRMNTYPQGTWQSWSIPYAVEMYNTRTGNCYRYAALTCWYARALGYEATAVSGEVQTSSGWAAHGWCEIIQDDEARIIDTVQHRAAASKNFFLVSYQDAPLYYRKV